MPKTWGDRSVYRSGLIGRTVLDGKRTQAHDDAVAKSLRMQHVSLGRDDEIPEHLDSFGVLQDDVLVFAHGFHEVLVDDFAEAAPDVAVVHNKQVVAASDDIVADIGRGPIAVDRTLLVDQLFYEAPVCEDDCGAGP